jgi:hypothetical protein
MLRHHLTPLAITAGIIIGSISTGLLVLAVVAWRSRASIRDALRRGPRSGSNDDDNSSYSSGGSMLGALRSKLSKLSSATRGRMGSGRMGADEKSGRPAGLLSSGGVYSDAALPTSFRPAVTMSDSGTNTKISIPPAGKL